jgi:hypothetical protein
MAAQRPRLRLLALLAAVPALAGCALGERPTLVDSPAATPGAATSVVELLQAASSATFTATYDITPSLTGATSTATVLRSGVRERITIGDVDFFSDGTTSRTCVTGTAECVDGIDDARVSNLSITHAFWGQSAAQRAANESSRAVGPVSERNDTIAGRPATCLDVPLPGPDGQVGTMTICAVDAGPLARFFGADVSIELTSFSTTVDESLLSG